jgi:hypothetical protein
MNVAAHLARAQKAATLLADAGSQDEAGLLLEAGLAELDAAIAAAPATLAERVQQIVNEIADRLIGAIRTDVVGEAVAAAQA